MHHWDPQMKRRVVDEVPGREVVGSVDDQVVATEDVEGVVGSEASLVGDDLDAGVQRAEPRPR